MTVLDPFKGGNHLPLFASLMGSTFTIVCNRSKVPAQDLPKNVRVVTVSGRLGPYYYGCSDIRFSSLVLKAYPAHSYFWQQFDVIHINQIMGPALRKLSTCDIPVLFLIHHPVTADREVALETEGGVRWRLRYFLLVHFQKKMCKAAHAIATVSKTMQKRIAVDYGVDFNKIYVVPNGVDTNVFTVVPDRECTTDVIAVGSFLHPRKGFSFLQKLYVDLAARNITIADVGRRSEKQVESMKNINNLTVYRAVDSSTLLECMQHSRVLVSTSLFEGFGLSLIEALSCGHPAFAFDVGAVREVLEPIDPELIVPKGDTKEMARRVEAYLALTALQREAKGKQYRESVKTLWNMDQSADVLQQLYKQISNN